MIIRLLTYIFFIFIAPFYIKAQNLEKIDSLETQLKKVAGKEEVDILLHIANEYIKNDVKNAFEYSLKAYQTAKSLQYIAGQIAANNLIGDCYLIKGDMKNALEYYNQVLEIYKTNNQQENIELAKTYNGLGNIYYLWGNYEKSVDYHFKSLRIREKFKDEVGIARCYNSLGNVYEYQGDMGKAIEYYLKALAIYEKLKMNLEIAGMLTNVGIVYANKKEYDKAVPYFQRALAINEQEEHLRGIADVCNEIGEIYFYQDNDVEALKYYQRALKIDEEIQNVSGIATTCNNIAKVYRVNEDYAKALEYYQKASDAAFQVKSKEDMKESFLSLAQIYESLQQYEDAYFYHKLYTQVKDTLLNIEKSKSINEISAKYNFEKKESEIEILKKNNEIKDLALQKRQTQMYFFISFLVFILALVLLLLNRNRVKTKANRKLQEVNEELASKNIEINQQKEEIISKSSSLEIAYDELRDKNKSITDSIQYAKRIQDSFLPNKEAILSHFKDGFIWSKPRDIVSGDYYWYYKKQNELILIAADCTGHGVPGALMTVLGNSLLNAIVHENQILNPAEILYNLDEKVRGTLHNQGTDKKQNDGMDMSVIHVNLDTHNLTFAGAKNPMYYITQDQPIQELKASKFPIGSSHLKMENKIFENHTLQMYPGDVLYLASDGFQDQFGEHTGRKYMTKRFRIFLEQISSLPMEKQMEKLTQEITIWQGEEKQTDDILIVGIRF